VIFQRPKRSYEIKKARKKKGSKERKHKEGKKSRKDLVKLIRPGE